MAGGEVAHACWLCDESYGCQANCMICDSDAQQCWIYRECSGCDIDCEDQQRECRTEAEVN
jgi:hypothetical protein